MAREEKLQLVDSDLKILTYLYDYLEWLSGQPYINTTDHNFFNQLQTRTGELYSNLMSADEAEKESLTQYIHGYLIIVMLKAVKISVTCAVCKSVCGKLSRRFREGILLDETIRHVATLERHVLEILNQVNDLDVKEQRSYTGDVEFYMRSFMAHNLVHYLLHDCDKMVTLCEEAVTDKVRSESIFFKVACLSVGALCAGMLLFNAKFLNFYSFSCRYMLYPDEVNIIKLAWSFYHDHY